MSCPCSEVWTSPRGVRVAGRIVGLSGGPRPRVLVRRPDGVELVVDVDNVSPDELRAFAVRTGLPLPRGLGGLDGLADDLGQLVDDVQANGRQWFFDRVREVSGLGVGYQALAARTDVLGRPDWSTVLREKAHEMSTVQDALYWLVDTYLGGVDQLPNVVPVPDRHPGVAYAPAPRVGAARVAPVVGVAPAVLAAALKGLGIVTAAALLAYIGSVAADYAVRVRQVEAAETNNNPNLLPEPDKGVIEQTTDLLGKLALAGLALLAWVNRDRILGAARSVGRRRAEA